MYRKLLAVIVSAALLFVMGISPGLAETETVPGEVLVVFRAPKTGMKITSQAVSSGRYSTYTDTIASSSGGRIAEVYDKLSEASGGIFALVKSNGESAQAIMDRLKLRDDVIAVSLNRRYKIYVAPVTPDDTQFSKLWGLQAINAPQAWAYSTGSSSVYSVVMDSGIDYTHGDISANFDAVHSASFAEGDSESDYGDGNGHGTHVAGTIGAVGNNEMGVAGVNWNTKLISLKCMGADGSGSDRTILGAINRLLDILSNDQDIKIAALNMSIGSDITSTDIPSSQLNTPYYLALKALDDTNRVVICAAAGNDGQEIGSGNYVYPASFTGLNNMIVVANAQNDSSYSRSSSSNYSASFTDIAAPGTSIWSTARRQ